MWPIRILRKNTYPLSLIIAATGREIILKLGEPSWAFEEGRILTYRLSLDRKGNVIPVKINNYKNDPNFSYAYPVATTYYSLVLVFSGNILEKHSLLLTNP
jgi:hypothetical protein